MGLLGEYSYIWNVTGFPSGVLPVTKVLADEQSFTDSCNDSWTEMLHQDAKGSVGMPISLQVTGYAYEDEKVCAIMKMLAESLSK